jgi:HEAT repeat protein/MFS family permease
MRATSAGQELPAVNPGPTKFEKLRALPWSLGYDTANTFFIQFTFFGSVFVLFLNDLGLNKTQIGFLLAAFPFLGLLSLFITPQVAKYGYKRTFLASFGVRNLFTAGLLLTPLIVAWFEARAVLAYVAAMTTGFAISRAAAMTAWLPWQQEYIPSEIRGKYSAYSSIFVSLAGLAAVSTAGYILGRPLGLGRYVILFGLGVLFGLVSIYLAAHIPGGAPGTGGTSIPRGQRKMLAPLRDRRFTRFLTGLGLVTLATGPVFSFLPLYMQEVVGLDAGSVVFLTTGSLIGSLLSSFFWGWMADRYGSRPVALTGLLLVSTLPVWWYLTPRGSALSLPIALGIAFFQGIAGSGWGIGSGRMLFVSLVPAESKTAYLSQYNAWMGLLGGLSSIFGGQLLDAFSGLQGDFFGFAIDSYTFLFAIGFLLPLVSALILRSIRSEREISMGEFAGLFFHGNPLLAVDSLIRFYFARDEPAAVAVTERLGRARSPLTVDELLESLEDPRFFVRFEAIVSISRHSPDERLTDALIRVLDGNDPALSVIAAWALGRIGNEKALPVLRRCLQSSRYRSVQAHAARSLGTLGDLESAPLLLERIRDAETDMGLKVACASALGKLKATEATPLLLDILARDRYPDSRKEMALALARLVDAENLYIQLMRSLRDDPGTELARQMETIKRLIGREQLVGEDLVAHVDQALESFARAELEAGLQALSRMIASLPMDRYGQHCQQILRECGGRIQEAGVERLEYAALAIVAIEKGVRQEG